MLYNKMKKSELVDILEERDIEVQSARNDSDYWSYESDKKDIIIRNLESKITETVIPENLEQEMELEALLKAFAQKWNL
jgi:hypothetical protein